MGTFPMGAHKLINATYTFAKALCPIFAKHSVRRLQMHLDVQSDKAPKEDMPDATFEAVIYGLMLLIFMNLLAACPDVSLAIDMQSSKYVCIPPWHVSSNCL
jgi:DNA polymerase III epsilon subunit-like protein